MIKAIDQQLFARRLIRNLEKFVGGREYRNDFRQLEWLSYCILLHIRLEAFVASPIGCGGSDVRLAWMKPLFIGTNIQKESQKRPNQARDGKEPKEVDRQQKDRKTKQTDKTDHGSRKRRAKNKCQSPKKCRKSRVAIRRIIIKPEPELKITIESNLNPSDGPGKPNSIS
ncbi:hypothetical protein Tco_0216751 [Tanacetum coccineum]